MLAGPKRAQNDMGSVEEQSIDDLLKLKAQAAADAAAGSSGVKLLLVRMVPPGAA